MNTDLSKMLTDDLKENIKKYMILPEDPQINNNEHQETETQKNS